MDLRLISDHELRQQVNAVLDRPVNDQEWAAVNQTGSVRRFRALGNPDGLAEEIQQFRRAFRGANVKSEKPGMLPAEKRKYGGLHGSDRVLAISDFIAQQARTREDVMQFRESVLRGRLIKPGDLEAWIKRQASADGPPTLLISVPLPQGDSIKMTEQGLVTTQPLDTTGKNAALSASSVLLDFGIPGVASTQHQPISISGALNQIRMVSDKLASDYGWQKAQATVFLLTDLVPVLENFSFSVRHGLLPIADRLSLTVDPSLSPRELMGLYRKVLQRVYGDDRQRVTDKHLRLAAFAVNRPENQTLADGMKVWNRQNPDLAYEYHTNFGRDLKDAMRKVQVADDAGLQRLRRGFALLAKQLNSGAMKGKRKRR
jgi:hypothetical protein